MNPIPTNLTGCGTLTVHFQYSCGIGIAHQPVKDKWTMGGATLIHHSMANVAQPPIRKFQPHSDIINFSTFGKVIAFGDSIMQQQFVRKLSVKAYFRPKVEWFQNPGTELNTAYFRYYMGKLETWHGEALRNSSNTALIVGSAAWDIMKKETKSRGPGFTDHFDICRRFIKKIRELYPTVTVVWKAPIAMVRAAGLL